MKLHREENKRMVGVLKLQGWTSEKIASRLKLTKNQVDHIKSYYYGKKKQETMSDGNLDLFNFEDVYKGTKKTTKENKIVENVKINSPISKTINLNGLEIEIVNSSINKVIITEKNKIKIL